VRKVISGLLRSSRPVLVMTVLVAVVGISGTAYAGKRDSGGNNGSPASTDSSQATQSASHGDKGESGDKSDRGNSHSSSKHHKTHKGEHSDTDYGVATVNVSRGHNPATAWATYSTALGSPVGDTTGGVFRFTCSTANAPCTVAVKAAVLSDSAGSTQIYPRVLIFRQDYNSGGPETYCEYGDGSTGSAPLDVTQQAPSSTPAYSAVPLNIGLTDDCGLGGAAGDVDQITVPAGYYDVQSTFVFLP
jgi:hypothetical protein